MPSGCFEYNLGDVGVCVALEQPLTAAITLQVSVLLGLFFEASETFVNRLIQNSHGFNMLSGGLADVAITFCGKLMHHGHTLKECIAVF